MGSTIDGRSDAPRSDLIRLETRPHQLIASHSRTVLVCDSDGMISSEEHGVFIHETRLLSRCNWTINGQTPYTCEATQIEQNSLLAYSIVHPHTRHSNYSGKKSLPEDPRGATEETIELRLATALSDGLHQDADVSNFTISPQKVEVELELNADFAGLDEVLSGKRQQHGRLDRRAAQGEVIWRYRAHHRGQSIDRSVIVRFRGLPPQTRWSKRGLSFVATLAPGEGIHICMEVAAEIDGHRLEPNLGCYALEATDPRQAQYLRETTRFARPAQPPALALGRSLERARQDLSALRMMDLDRGQDHDHPAWVPAAGIPNYVATFGRDILTAAWQSALLGPEIMRGALQVLQEMQGKHNDAWRDEEPGKMLHEAHTGPSSVLAYRPQGRYYGSFNTSPFYAIVLSEFFHWTGDKAATLHYLPAARAAMDWMDRYGHPGHKHFFAFRTRSSQGVKNQGWKDSGDALIYPDGKIVPDPIAGCPIQGFAYEAKLRMAELHWIAGERGAAARMLRQAHELKQRFNDEFWMPEENYYAMALDPKGRQVRSIGSDPGDALATGIIAGERAKFVVDRLFSEDLFSGWGIRTLSSQHLAYNPYSYHRGSVWPAENSAIGVGLRRYGFSDELCRLLYAQMEIAERFQFARLPEVICGHAKNEAQPFPPIYPKSCSPQAWSAGAPLILTQMVLGMYPYAPFHTLFLDPRLPDWLPEFDLHGLRVGDAVVDLSFRGPDQYEIKNLQGHLRVVKQPSPWSVFATKMERAEDLVESAFHWWGEWLGGKSAA
ncbi:MAG TPA: glycogen debranching N-terminal domain-containing protein [Terriglobales bacterium]|nr:glycogen debranching N-terminal domain-containing protein [Terriglobales bacterium]